MISIQKKLQQAHRGFAYEMLQLQMAVEDQKSGCLPSITEIIRLIQLYMIGVEVLQSIADPRFSYFNNKIHALMLKKHIVKKLYESSGRQNLEKTSILAANKAELKGKKDQYQINIYFNQGQIDLKKVKEMLNLAESKKVQVQSKIKTDLKKQQDRLQQRIRQRKMRSQAGSVKKYNIGSEQDVPSPVGKKQLNKDPMAEYFNMTDTKFIDLLPKNKVMRTNSGSLEKNILDRKNLKKQMGSGLIGGSAQKQDPNDAI